jgi:hypothetical protein
LVVIKKAAPWGAAFQYCLFQESGVTLFVGTLCPALASGTFEAVVNRRFHEVRIFAKLLQNARSLVLFLETLEKLVDRFIFIYLNTDQ